MIKERPKIIINEYMYYVYNVQRLSAANELSNIKSENNKERRGYMFKI